MEILMSYGTMPACHTCSISFNLEQLEARIAALFLVALVRKAGCRDQCRGRIKIDRGSGDKGHVALCAEEEALTIIIPWPDRIHHDGVVYSFVTVLVKEYHHLPFQEGYRVL